ncbi:MULTISPECIES: hypothetical protein [Streptomyces]|uniref:Uncharacterized protein n=1 Tax=Streptomyces glycanivorans TaxID=3033808 RepID=A0ABY9JM09_9ACTN|nr:MULTISPECIES: hypothetical protein [unclassified Streptomyces]WSQ82005.1 hypothetical protein OG725_35150 [Streptomyces sp. NBC_01213]WLQ68648.1 hypothetical protein P8A20_36140 [Streptomyces sp. Alt3]WSQ89332.1 hypothetical protein OG722_35545 [Streptomyces sp. NBC_01212]WSR04660.1 hypothetical protein OG265_00955 [Streptomyces sp. NBC_01208]WSR52724.1 hypothetical protein OG279_36140 [Streptomyces sp. NBC_01201]
MEILHWELQGSGVGSSQLSAHMLSLADRLFIPAVLTITARAGDRASAAAGNPRTRQA